MNTKIYATLLIATWLLSGCAKNDAPDPETGKGAVAFTCSISGAVDEIATSKADPQRELPAECIPQTEQLSLVLSSDIGIVGSYEVMSDYDQPLLTQGNYNAAFTFGDQNQEGPNACYFTGNTDFTIVARKTITQPVSLTLANSLYSLTCTDWFMKYFTDYEFTVRTESGLQTTFDKPVSETDPIFVKAGTKLFLSGKATKTNGVEIEFQETEIGTTAARTWHTITVDAGEANDVAINILFNNSLITAESIDVELNPDAE